MSSRRPTRKEATGSDHALGAFALLFAINAALGLACLGMAAAGVLIAQHGFWRALVGALLVLAGLAGTAFFAGGIFDDYRTTGVSFRREAANVWRRLRRRPGGREQFASQRFTRNGARRRP